MKPRARAAGFSLMELLIAIFVLSVAVAGTIGVIYAAARTAGFARRRALAPGLAEVALADALYAAEEYRELHAGALDFGDTSFFAPADGYSQIMPGDELGPAGCQRTGYRKRAGVTDFGYGWLWRAHSFEAATGLYSLDVWVFRSPTEQWVKWGYADERYRAELRRDTLFYMRTKLETRKR
jgi:prepilin-type N-terminal cleavage/methylation domain-containing protein